MLVILLKGISQECHLTWSVDDETPLLLAVKVPFSIPSHKVWKNKENHAENFFRKNAENYVQMSADNTKAFKVYRITVKQNVVQSLTRRIS